MKSVYDIVKFKGCIWFEPEMKNKEVEGWPSIYFTDHCVERAIYVNPFNIDMSSSGSGGPQDLCTIKPSTMEFQNFDSFYIVTEREASEYWFIFLDYIDKKDKENYKQKYCAFLLHNDNVLRKELVDKFSKWLEYEIAPIVECEFFNKWFEQVNKNIEEN